MLGGLNYQIEHHLFPSMPRPNLRRVQGLVRDFCAAADLSYSEESLVGSFRQVIQHLSDAGAAASRPRQPAFVASGSAADAASQPDSAQMIPLYANRRSVTLRTRRASDLASLVLNLASLVLSRGGARR
jgi:hypothetical protein